MIKPTAWTFRHIISQALERAKLTTSYALLERDLFRAHGPTAVRHLTDDERRQLARLGVVRKNPLPKIPPLVPDCFFAYA